MNTYALQWFIHLYIVLLPFVCNSIYILKIHIYLLIGLLLREYYPTMFTFFVESVVPPPLQPVLLGSTFIPSLGLTTKRNGLLALIVYTVYRWIYQIVSY